MTDIGVNLDEQAPATGTTVDHTTENGGNGRTRRRAPGADPVVRSFGTSRICAAENCGTRLSRYNPDTYCSMHRGWDKQVVTRRRRAST